MSHRDSPIKKNKHLFSIMDIYNVGFVGAAGGVAGGPPTYTGSSVIDTANSGGYRYLEFLENGSIIMTQDTVVKALVVGAGGDGHVSISAGGGAGEVMLTNDFTVPAGTYPVVVGAGGVNAPRTHQNGNNSTFRGITAKGGGKAGPYQGAPGYVGGSGGGASGYGFRGGGGTSSGGFGPYATGTSYMNNGGNSGGSGSYGCGGGGGAGGSGSPASGQNGGPGGSGISISSFPTTYTYGGGGGGGAYGPAGGGGRPGGSGGGGGGAAHNGSVDGSGGTGGRNNGGPGGSGTAHGGTNTGSGGGGGQGGGVGGSGIVVIRHTA
jgi:hypothetical protein